MPEVLTTAGQFRTGTKKDVELLAPVGDWDGMRAAVANGADAVFFGVEKFHARARNKNFTMDELPEIMRFLRGYGVRGFLTFNILIFEEELLSAQELVEACIDAGVDAVIVQDLGLVKMIREISPDFPIHGSTQMTITSPEAVEFIKPWDLELVVLGRENNLKQIRQIGEQAKLPMEVFVHGALCVSYSGQCLTSEMWGGRSANRGECAQACRLPYDMVVDGDVKPMGDVAYLLSPKDLAAVDLIPELIEAGVRSFKIEGRYKSAEYVANVVSKYRKAIDDYYAGKQGGPSREEMRELQQSFSRGFTHGFLKGTNNKQLVDGTFPKSRGVYLGTVLTVHRDSVVCKLEAPLKRGDGIVFDAGDPTQEEEGGRVYDLRRNGQKLDGEAGEGWQVEIVPGRHDVNVKRVHVGDRIWKTNDPALDRRLRQSFETERPYRVFPLHVRVTGSAGQPMKTWWTDVEKGKTVILESEMPLETALKRPLDEELLREQFGRTGGTLYKLDAVEVQLKGDVIVPKSELNRMRREAVEQLEELRKQPPIYMKRKVDPYADGFDRGAQRPALAASPALTVLCRSLDQVRAAAEHGAAMIYADFEFIKQFPAAVETARAAGQQIGLVTPRIHMPGETGYFEHMLRLQPDAILVRNTGALYYLNKKRLETGEAAAFPRLVGDFSLNAANHKTVQLLHDAGCERVTPSYDLNIQQMIDLMRRTDTFRLELVLHQHLPMFHTEHCVYCTFLSEGTDYTNCGRPCEQHRVSLKDRIGMDHPVRVDEGCRNTVYNAIEQSGSEYLPQFLELGVNRFRIEFLEESADKVREVLMLYGEALAGRISGTQVWRKLKATNQLGVTRGQLVK
ncbi:peptidase U32 [Xylanibacillus composti]|uniref:Peptidase U32 n=1 Tax=Xylanibacillus composti TaxID=1572762 RepID=A0A8J4H5N7_9BACL|nr:U32 family peptidase [Xylanibacillus composti]GIQ70017.1 peptidase U32 [Xylanibacillus composti]